MLNRLLLHPLALHWVCLSLPGSAQSRPRQFPGTLLPQDGFPMRGRPHGSLATAVALPRGQMVSEQRDGPT